MDHTTSGGIHYYNKLLSARNLILCGEIKKIFYENPGYWKNFEMEPQIYPKDVWGLFRILFVGFNQGRYPETIVIYILYSWKIMKNEIVLHSIHNIIVKGDYYWYGKIQITLNIEYFLLMNLHFAPQIVYARINNSIPLLECFVFS